jgi:signal transduction histidine kinase
MKLSIQYLQKAIESNAPNVKELTAQVANTLVEQIEHLSQIAGDFSQFAHIGESAREEVNLNDVLDKVLDLYASNEKLVISKQLLEEPVRVIGDRTHMNRLFNNLVLNAIQAVPDDRVARIDIRETLSDGKVLISISDNGQGINQELQSRIFAPNFTTKTSGTGLGLAMCKRIVEQAEGEIWFDTTPGTGTSFFVMFPLMSS